MRPALDQFYVGDITDIPTWEGYLYLADGPGCLRRRMGSVGGRYDGAMAESFFATLECEVIQQSRFRSRAEARQAVFSFIEG